MGNRKNIKDTDYSELQQYSIIAYMNGNNAPTTEMTFTKKDKILACMLPDENDFMTSIINGNEVKLFKTENFEDKNKINGEAFFVHNGYKFYIESRKIDEKDFIDMIKSILEQSIVSNEADKDINVNEYVNSNVNYQKYYAGKYIDNNGNNVILLTDDTAENRKQICNDLGIKESKTIFKKANYTYEYLAELQTKISQKMQNKELPFVTSSSLMEDSNNIKVTVTSNDVSDLNKIKELDTIGGAIDIRYSTNENEKQDLVILE